jgi:pyrroline-5-carboxylate reductase
MTNTASPSPRLPGPLLLLGAGRMGSAMLRGWLAAGVDPGLIMVQEPAPAGLLRELVDRHGLLLNPPPDRLARAAVLVVAVKPQVMDAALAPLAPLFAERPPLVLSIAAGRTIASFKRHFGDTTPVVRAMPNTPAAIGRGISAFCASPEVDMAGKALARALLEALGEVVEVPQEEQMDAVTAVSGSGPAYVFLLAECLEQAALAEGLPADVAARLARATVAGAGALLDQAPEPPAALREAVTSPGGTTAAALGVLMEEEGGLCRLMRRAVAAATRRSRELAGEG